MFFVGAGITEYTEPNRNYIVTQGRDHIIRNKCMSFKLKTCSTTYVDLGLLYWKSLFWPVYTIVLGGLNAESYIMWSGQTRSYKNQQQVSHCGMHADFFITWKDHTITVRHGLKSNGSVFLTWTRRWDLWSFSDIRLGTIEEGEWIFYTEGMTITIRTITL